MCAPHDRQTFVTVVEKAETLKAAARRFQKAFIAVPFVADDAEPSDKYSETTVAVVRLWSLIMTGLVSRPS
jgi:hypothetical protein